MAYWSAIHSTKKALKGVPISAKCVLVSSNQKMLVMRKASGLYDLPGGKVESREDIYRALRREIMEETGLKVKRFSFLASWVKQQPGYTPRLVIVFQASLKKRSGQIDLDLSDEHDWGAFVPPKKALKLPMAVGYKNAIAMSAQRRLRL